jgi:hypothetical protein
MSAHTCHAVACEATCPPKYLMCGRHWRMVPTVLQEAVWANYRPGQEQRGLPTDEWFQAARAAQVAVADLEGHSAPRVEAYRRRGAKYLALLAVPSE